MAEPQGWLRTEATDGTVRVVAGGAWETESLAAIDAGLRQVAADGPRGARIDVAGVESLDTAGAWVLYRTVRDLRARGIAAEIVGARPAHQALIERVARADRGAPPRRAPPGALVSLLDRTGRALVAGLVEFGGLLSFLGLAAIVQARAWRHPGRIRLIALFSQIERTGLDAMPIVGLLAFLIGVVTAYQGADQLRRFGAEIFTINLVGVSMLREMGVLLAAIMVAGRSGSAFTAQIGTMQVNEEVDAMRTMGLDPIEVLVLPRVWALVIVLPLLTVWGDLTGIIGGQLMAWAALDISTVQFFERLNNRGADLVVLGGSDQGAGVRPADRPDRLPRGAQGLGQRGKRRAAHDAFGGVLDLPGHRGRRRLFHRLLRGARMSGPARGEGMAIRVRGLVTRFGRTTVHDGVDLDVRRGEVFAIVGGSGSGKSVLLRTILRLNRQAAGSVEMLGQETAGLGDEAWRALERRYGVLFQQGALFSSLTVGQNVEVPLKEHTALPPALIHEIAAVKVAMVGLEPDAAGKYPSELSGGMRKRAALARALALDPEILFLDEPTAGLDPIGAAAFDALIGTLREALDLTVVMVTHDLDTLYAICDRVAVLVDKRVIAGTLDELEAYDHPWIRDYFHGPRARAAVAAAEG